MPIHADSRRRRQPTQTVFHLAINVIDLEQTRGFYGELLRCVEGRNTQTWEDFDFFGHQLPCHLGEPLRTRPTGKVGEHMVLMPHSGAVLPMEDWKALALRLETAGVDFTLKPQVRFAGEQGEQSTMFFCDPSGNPVELKGFADVDGIFAVEGIARHT